jgi:putative membrane protein PagO
VTARPRLAIALAFAGICLIWGTTWLAIKIGLRDAPPMTAVGLRFIIAGSVLYVVAALRGALVPLRALPWRLVLVYAVLLFGVNYILTYVAEEGLSSGLTAVLFATLPFFTFLFRAVIYRERTTASMWIGTVFAFAGVAVIALDGGVSGSLPYVVACLVSAAMAAYANIYGKRRPDVQPLTSLPPAMLLGGIGVAALGVIFEHPAPAVFLAPASLGALLYLALIGSSLAFFLNSWLLQRIDVSTLNLAPLIFPLVALAVGALIAHEVVHVIDGLGIALIIGGTWYSIARPANGNRTAGDLRIEDR